MIYKNLLCTNLTIKLQLRNKEVPLKMTLWRLIHIRLLTNVTLLVMIALSRLNNGCSLLATASSLDRLFSMNSSPDCTDLQSPWTVVLWKELYMEVMYIKERKL